MLLFLLIIADHFHRHRCPPALHPDNKIGYIRRSVHTFIKGSALRRQLRICSFIKNHFFQFNLTFVLCSFNYPKSQLLS